MGTSCRLRVFAPRTGVDKGGPGGPGPPNDRAKKKGRGYFYQMSNMYTCIAYLIEIRKFCSKNLVHKGVNFDAQNAQTHPQAFLISKNSAGYTPGPLLKGGGEKVKVAHTRQPSVGFRRRSRFLAVSLQVTSICCRFVVDMSVPSVL